MPTIKEDSLLKDIRTIIEAVRFDPRLEIRRASVPVAARRATTTHIYGIETMDRIAE